MSVLSDHVTVSARFARSANLERDVTRLEPLEGYVVTARALDVVSRMATVAANGRAGGAWSVTGPYGSGKSSLALLLDAAFGPDDGTRHRAIQLINDASPATADLIGRAHERHHTCRYGFYRAVATAQRESISHTILRALHSAVIRRHGKIPHSSAFSAASALRSALADAASENPRRTGPSPASLIEVARCLALDAPLLIAIDEFGKNLEAIRDTYHADPYILQQLAEMAEQEDTPILVLTLQHLSFEDYFAGTEGPQRREWAKIQGRFEDIPYMESALQTRSLMGTVFHILTPDLGRRVETWAVEQARAMSRIGLNDLTNPAIVASCYPVHPIGAAVLPELCSRYGQNERTLFSFLTGDGPTGVATFLQTTSLPDRGVPPTIGLGEIYEYFVAGGAFSPAMASQSSRWTEIATRVRDTHGLTSVQHDLLRAIAVLNLVSMNGSLRASAAVLEEYQPGSATTISKLEEFGLVTYRDFADEYRIWQGSDVDLRHLQDVSRQRLKNRSLADLLTDIDAPVPIVAARHSAEHDVLRVFARRYVNGDEGVEPLDPFSSVDGEVLLVVGSGGKLPNIAKTNGHMKPILAAIPTSSSRLDDAAREVAALIAVLNDPIVVDDWVARREIGERLAQARGNLADAVSTTFSDTACRWVLLDGGANVEIKGGRGSAALSNAADRIYTSTPVVRNEMLNRTEVTSQGAKARRVLLEAMLTSADNVDLGFEGYGPEMAMYRSFLGNTGLHGWDARNNTFVFRSPSDLSLRPAWDMLDSEFRRARTRRINIRDLYAALLLPPIGMKAGVIPVLITAALLAYSDEIAIYEHGTFKPVLSAGMSERMVRNPGHFEIKHFASTIGARRQVVDAIADQLGVTPRFRKHRVSNVLAIVGHIVPQLTSLDNFTSRTLSLSPSTLAARNALLEAVEPDDLLFDVLPAALGFDPIPPDIKHYSHAQDYAAAIKACLNDLDGRYWALLDEILSELLEVCAEPSRLALSRQAGSLAEGVLDPAMRGLVMTLANDIVESDRDWIEAVATVMTRKAVMEWTDSDRARFSRELPAKMSAFYRLVALHAEQRVEGGGGFGALRVTITRADGAEHARLVSIDEEQRDAAEQVLNAAVAEIAGLLGSTSRAQQSLLAILGDRVLNSGALSDGIATPLD